MNRSEWLHSTVSELALKAGLNQLPQIKIEKLHGKHPVNLTRGAGLESERSVFSPYVLSVDAEALEEREEEELRYWLALMLVVLNITAHPAYLRRQIIFLSVPSLMWLGVVCYFTATQSRIWLLGLLALPLTFTLGFSLTGIRAGYQAVQRHLRAIEITGDRVTPFRILAGEGTQGSAAVSRLLQKALAERTSMKA
ncbi:MAG TPA: hypothetical protein VEX38_05935 [Fimbriimonadaceae bacterium]|nr:hypothetical protein [Fimbriimonadaceae bacterium]